MRSVLVLSSRPKVEGNGVTSSQMTTRPIRGDRIRGEVDDSVRASLVTRTDYKELAS